MRFSYAESMCDPSYYIPLARAAEDSGWTTFMVPDSICYPEISDSTYPYTPTGEREFLEGKPFIEPMSLIPALGAVTERLRFATFVVKLPIREPVLVAKSITSVAVLTGGRFDFGVGLSPWPEDFQVCNQEFAKRGKRMNEMIEMIRGLMTGDFYEFHGEHFDLPSIKLCPVPQRPVPILIGGHSEAALKRAARLGDGWMHAGGDPTRLSEYLARLAALRREYGTDQKPFKIFAISMDAYKRDGITRLQDLGITDVVVGFRNAYAMGHDTQPLSAKIDAMRRYADTVIGSV